MRSSKKVNGILQKQVDALFFQTVADIKTAKEAELFLHDFLTESEKENFAKRLAVAYWLKKGRSYKNIKDNLKVSSATVASVQDIVSKKGVQMALKNIEADEWANQWSEKISKAWPNGLKKIVGK